MANKIINQLSESIKPIGEFSTISYEEVHSTRIRYDESGQTIQESTLKGGHVNLLYNGFYGGVSFADIKQIEESYAKAKLIATHLKHNADTAMFSKYIPYPRVTFSNEESALDIDLINKITLEQKIKRILGYISEIRKLKNADLHFIYEDKLTRKYFVSSEHSQIFQISPECYIHINLSKEDGDRKQTIIKLYSGANFSDLVKMENDLYSLGSELGELVQASPIKPGKYRALISPYAFAGVLHETMGHFLEADSFIDSSKIGMDFDNPEICVYDDGDYYIYDDEEIKKTRTVLVREGVICNCVHNRRTANIFNVEPAGNARSAGFAHPPIVRSTNTVMQAGKEAFENLLIGLKEGIFITSALDGDCNAPFFHLKYVTIHEVKRGQIGRRLKNGVLRDNIFEVFKRIEVIGNKVEFFPYFMCAKSGQWLLGVGSGSPYILVSEINIEV
jgi:TldD protein